MSQISWSSMTLLLLLYLPTVTGLSSPHVITTRPDLCTRNLPTRPPGALVLSAVMSRGAVRP